jgi:putative transcriptional regulator
MENLKGRLLVANAQIFDPNFRRNVVLLADHDANGALGVVLNQPTSMTVGEAVPALAGAIPSEEPVFFGGPVQPRAVIVLAECDHPDLLSIPVVGNVGVLTGEIHEDTVRRIRKGRVFAGYAGWGAGQLDAELENSDWVVASVRAEDIFAQDPASLWSAVLRREGKQHRLLATMPLDPGSN